MAVRMTCVGRDVRDHLLQHRREVLEDDDGLGARILELVLQLARRVERVGVDHHKARGSTAATATGYWKTLGIMIATRSPLQAQSLQIRRQRARGGIDLGKAHALAIIIRRAVRHAS